MSPWLKDSHPHSRNNNLISFITAITEVLKNSTENDVHNIKVFPYKYNVRVKGIEDKNIHHETTLHGPELYRGAMCAGLHLCSHVEIPLAEDKVI